MPDYAARCELLTRENDELRERILQLEEALGIRHAVPVILGLTPTEGTLLGMLARREIVTKDSAMCVLYEARPDADAVPDIKIIDVLICKLRAKLAPFGIDIETDWATGFYMKADAKQQLRNLSAGEGIAA